LLPGKIARQFRSSSAKVVCRVLGGDVSICEEIEKRHAQLQSTEEGARAQEFLLQDSKPSAEMVMVSRQELEMEVYAEEKRLQLKRLRDAYEDEREEKKKEREEKDKERKENDIARKMRIEQLQIDGKVHRLNAEESQRKTQLNTSVFMLDMLRTHDLMRIDSNIEVSLLDQIKNATLPPASAATLMLENGDAEISQPNYLTVEGWLLESHNSPTYLNMRFKSKMGRIMATLYRTEVGQEPRTVKKHVNGEMRDVKVYDVNAYSHIFDDAFNQSIEENAARSGA
jgi:hypothetical protein